MKIFDKDYSFIILCMLIYCLCETYTSVSNLKKEQAAQSKDISWLFQEIKELSDKIKELDEKIEELGSKIDDLESKVIDLEFEQIMRS